MDYQAIVEELKNRVDLVKFIGQYTQLKIRPDLPGYLRPASRQQHAFLTVPDTQSYYCFGCKSGSIIEFVKAHYNYDFHEAINFWPRPPA